MGQWTHVSGCIRVDNFLERNFEKKLRERFGNCVSYNGLKEEWDACNVPLGSEGSVMYDVQKTSESESQVSWGVVYIWGDLRDYSDYNAIYQWIKKSCKGLMIRSCAVKIDVEYQGSYFVYDKWNDDTQETDILIVRNQE